MNDENEGDAKQHNSDHQERQKWPHVVVAAAVAVVLFRLIRTKRYLSVAINVICMQHINLRGDT